ncbi:MAG: glutamine synthetase family protein [Lachnospiraceae bacterium]|nr:glutamine synthetase family protein [Lachnospiraceae bacterium]
MLYTKQEVQDYVKEEDVKFIRLAFCDVFGTPKNISILPGELSRAFEYGISFDASAIRCFGSEEKSDLFLFPDPSTLSLLPWRPSHGRVVRMFCDIKHPDGTPFELDTRYILKKAIREAKDAGIMCYFGPEFEFYLFKTDETGLPTNIPFDNAGYMDMAPEDAGENVRREICLTLEEMGIIPESSHHEEGPGQNEIDFRYSDALSSADNAVTFKTVVKTAASRNGLYASFDPKPIPDKSGNGMHINMSPVSLNTLNNKDFFKAFMAGIMAHIYDITLFLNPSEGSYRRLGGHKAPKYITWSPENRSQLIRIPADDKSRLRIELRSPDALSNPYMAYALLIYSGLDGIKNNLTPPPSTDINLYSAGSETLKLFKMLPSSLKESIKAMKESSFVRNHIPAAILEAYENLLF